jgi:AraC family transcriptional activator of pobA
MARQQPIPAPLVVQRIDSRLDETVWRLAGDPGPARGFVLLDDGEGWLEAASAGREELAAPALRWLAHPGGLRFRARAGSAGYAGTVSEAFLSEVGAGYPDASLLGFIAGQDHHITRLAGGESRYDLTAIFAALHAELQAEAPGAAIMLAAQVRILLVAMLRLSDLEVPLAGSGADGRFLMQFRELLESNFRAHWPVSRYAERIGISPDRLHSLCTRRLGRTPRALIAERVAREATLGLERSTMSLEQLSYSLGFRDPAHFSHFFKRVVGTSPGAHRRRALDTGREPQPPPVTFADWP